MNLLHLKVKCSPFYSLFRENVLHFEVNVPSLTIPFEIFCHNGTIIILSLTTSYQDTLLPSIYILLKVYIVQIYTLRKYVIYVIIVMRFSGLLRLQFTGLLIHLAVFMF